ncbi:MAG: hypothetical protein M3Y24_08570 [Acidobacteriota bacterium]|nr:hypothetical protein [Acidobacteriota bacterium]
MRFFTVPAALHYREGKDSSGYERDSLIEFLKTLQVLPPGTRNLIVDDKFRKKVRRQS